MEPTATPITEPAIPIFADNKNDVTAASAPAPSWENEIPLKKFLTMPDLNSLDFENAGQSMKTLKFLQVTHVISIVNPFYLLHTVMPPV
jgi:hypothetical protein